jgi:two-component system response regulator FixJ
MTARPPLIHVLEDDPAVRDSLVALLDSWGFSARPFESAAALEAAEPARADALLLDYRLPGADGLETLRRLRAAAPSTPIMVISAYASAEMAVSALREGAGDVLEKPFEGAELVRRLMALLGRGGADPAADGGPFERLTPREHEVMRAVVAGLSNKGIARCLGLSPKTVEIHRARVMEKTESRNLSELVRKALKAGIDPEAGPAPPGTPARSGNRDSS